jgi:hypothetical protein
MDLAGRLRWNLHLTVPLRDRRNIQRDVNKEKSLPANVDQDAQKEHDFHTFTFHKSLAALRHIHICTEYSNASNKLIKIWFMQAQMS